MRFGANEHPIDRLGLRRIGQHAKRSCDRAFRPLQRKPRNRLARAGRDIMPPGCCETARGAAADAAKPDHRDAQPPRLRPSRHGCSTLSEENRYSHCKAAAKPSIREDREAWSDIEVGQFIAKRSLPAT